MTDPEPGPPYGKDAIYAATIGGAKALGLVGEVGRLQAGMKADLTILDLADISFVPLNSVARQVVFTEAGRSVETVIIDGRIVMRDRRIVTVDEAALRRSVEEVMKVLRADLAEVVERLKPVHHHIMNAHLRTSAADLGMGRTRRQRPMMEMLNREASI